METESNLLKISILGTAAFAILGIAFGLILNSKIIFFDGIYSLGGIFLSFLSLLGSCYVEKEHKGFSLKKKLLENFIILFKSLVIFIMCIYSLVGALREIFRGGSMVRYDHALSYALISTLGCFLIYLFLKIRGREIKSSLVNIESSQWLMDAFLSLGVLGGFLIGNILKSTEFFWINKYLDQIMVIVCSIAFLKMPIKSFIFSLKEIFSFRKEEFLKKSFIEKDFKITLLERKA